MTFLTEEKAKLRKQQIAGEISYECFIVLSRGKQYHALIKIDFQCINTENIFLDFSGKEI